MVAKSSLSLIDFDGIGNFIKKISIESILEVKLSQNTSYFYCIINRRFEKFLRKPKPTCNKLFLWLFIVGKKVVSYRKLNRAIVARC